MKNQIKIFAFALLGILLGACSDKYYEMYKSPCACFEDIKKQEYKQLNKAKLKQSLYLPSNTKSLLKEAHNA